ncbi:MAG: hypothetical protein AAB401_19930, partial [Acidobacteriota bacterium]
GQSARLSHAAGLAVSFGAFLWTHPPTAYQFLLVFGSCVVASTIRAGRAGKWRELSWIAAALVFGSMLAAAYFYPAIAEQRRVNSDDVQRVWPYHASYVFDYAQTVYDRVGNQFFVRLDRIWAFNLAAILTLSVALWKRRTAGGRCSEYRLQVEEAAGLPAKAGTLNTRVWLWIAAGLLASFLMTKYSAPIGRLIPKIEIGVYSWRMLTLTSFALAMLAGAVWDRVSTATGRERVVIETRSLPVAVLIGALAMSGYYIVWPMWRAQSFEPNLQHYNYATLPLGSPRENPVMPPVQLADGKGSISVERWTSEFRQLRVSLSEADQLQFRTRNFAGWTATVDGKIAPIKEGAVKNILVDLPAGDTRVTLEFRSTPIRRVSNWVTVISFALLLSIIVFTKRRNL